MYWIAEINVRIEYNLDTSAEHPEMDDDIVWYSSERGEYKIKSLYITNVL